MRLKPGGEGRHSWSILGEAIFKIPAEKDPFLMLSPPKIGLLGFGGVGRSVIDRWNEIDETKLRFYWVADSQQVVSRIDGREFSPADFSRMSQAKLSQGKEGLASLKSPFKVSHFSNTREEATILNSMVEKDRTRWIVIDTTFSSASDSFFLLSNLMGTMGICAANKTAWAERSYCKQLYSQAQEKRTFLALNCTQGVWVDQMEYLPLAVTSMGREKMRVRKRDNPSLNLLFAKVASGMPAKRALEEIIARGFLEPGATDLLPEVKDQLIKARITANMCATISGYNLKTPKTTIPELLRAGPGTADVDDLSSWHLRGRKHGVYPALVTDMTIDGTDKSVNFELGFERLLEGDPLGRDFPGKSAFSVERAGRRHRRGGRGIFVHAGFGGTFRTGKKLVHDAEQIARRSSLEQKGEFEPLPILAALASKDRGALRKRAQIQFLGFPS